jgi:hypothetical protein
VPAESTPAIRNPLLEPGNPAGRPLAAWNDEIVEGFRNRERP